MKRLLLAGVLLAIPAAAQARNWWTISLSGECVRATQIANRYHRPYEATPFLFEKEMQREGRLVGIQTGHGYLETTGVGIVAVDFDRTEIIYFAAYGDCKVLTSILRQKGLVAQEKELN